MNQPWPIPRRSTSRSSSPWQETTPSKMADIQHRLGVDVNYASQYRLRLRLGASADVRGCARVEMLAVFWEVPLDSLVCKVPLADTEVKCHDRRFFRRAFGHGLIRGDV